MSSQPSNKLVARLLAAGLLPVDAIAVARRAEETGNALPSYLDADIDAEPDVAGSFQDSRSWWLVFASKYERLRTFALLLEARRANIPGGGEG